MQDLLGAVTVPRAGLPDDALEAHGFDNFPELQNATDLHVNRYASAARSLAQQAVAAPAKLLACDVAAQSEEVCACRFAAAFARQAFRRPPGADEETRLCEFYKAERKKYPFTEALEQLVTAILQSPHFLYRVESGTAGAPLGAHEMASRLSYLLWGSMPDRELATAADRDALRTDAQVQAQVERMLGDPRARRADRGRRRAEAV